MKLLRRTILLLVVFSIAMGFLETAVVVYLRQLFYPGGFQLPMVNTPPLDTVTELLREAATIIMLFTIAAVAAKNAAQRFAYFLLCFAVWDLCYYLFLKILLGWPESLLTWDILFLLPVPWYGPVAAPCILSVTMIVLAFLILKLQSADATFRIVRTEWLLLSAGALIAILSFTMDYVHFVKDLKISSGNSLPPGSGALEYAPASFNWLLFSVGELTTCLGIAAMARRNRKQALPQS